MRELARDACGCRVTADDEGTMHIWPCCDAHGETLAGLARTALPDAQVDVVRDS